MGLAEAVTGIRDRINRYREQGRKLNEQNTKAALIEPVIRALGWNVEDVEEVHREYRLKKRDKPVDYALLVLRNARLFIEAKALGENLSDRRWTNQIMGYATVAGVEWIVLTDGNEYRIYNSHAAVAVDEKLFRSFEITDDSAAVLDTLDLLSKERLEENRIEVLWRAHFVDRQVKTAIGNLFSGDSDLLLVNHIANQTKDLTPHEIRASLARCQLTLDFPLDAETVAPTKPSRARRRSKRAGNPSDAATQERVEIADLIRAGILKPPLELIRSYKGQSLSARVTASGKVRWGGDDFDSPSSAAGAARASIVGRGAGGEYPHTNGWTFWKYEDADKQLVELACLRTAYLSFKKGVG